MASIKINQGDTLSAIAAKNKTDVKTLMSLNQANPSVKSANLIKIGRAHV